MNDDLKIEKNLSEQSYRDMKEILGKGKPSREESVKGTGLIGRMGRGGCKHFNATAVLCAYSRKGKRWAESKSESKGKYLILKISIGHPEELVLYPMAGVYKLAPSSRVPVLCGKHKVFMF